MNFEQKTKKFIPGFYTLEFFSIPTYCLVYRNIKSNFSKINNSGLILTFFNSLPVDATINKH